jgi:hypothetical protein
MARDDHPQGAPTLARLAERFRLVCSHPCGLRRAQTLDEVEERQWAVV